MLDVCEPSLDDLNAKPKAICLAAAAPIVSQQEKEKKAATKLRSKLAKQPLEARFDMF
jgi:hypothetical protein